MSEYKQLQSEVYPDVVIDAKGLYSPIPLLRLKRELEQATSGIILQVDCSDSNSYNDIVSWCSHANHKFLGEKRHNLYSSYYVVKN